MILFQFWELDNKLHNKYTALKDPQNWYNIKLIKMQK